MQTILEMTVSPVYTRRADRRLQLLKLLRIVLSAVLISSWIYGIFIAAAFLQQTDGKATQWLLFFVIFTIPATVLLILVWRALRRFYREYDYLLQDHCLEIYVSVNPGHRKLLTQINCHAIVAFAPLSQASKHDGPIIRAIVGSAEVWALDVRHEGQTVRVLLQPNEAFCHRLKSHLK